MIESRLHEGTMRRIMNSFTRLELVAVAAREKRLRQEDMIEAIRNEKACVAELLKLCGKQISGNPGFH